MAAAGEAGGGILFDEECTREGSGDGMQAFLFEGESDALAGFLSAIA